VTIPSKPKGGPRQTPAVAEFLRVRRRLAQGVLALLGVTAVGIVGFAIIGRGQHSLVDAIYMTVITLTTVGFGEIIDMSHNPAGRLFTVGLLLLGVGIVAYTVPMLAAFLIEGQLLHHFSRRRMDRAIDRLTGHYIVCGQTAATWYVADELRRSGRQVVLVVPTEQAAAQAFERLGETLRVLGDPSDDDVLLEAGIERAAGLVACMENHKDNVLVSLAARRLAPAARIVASTETPDSEGKLRTAGADAVVSPSRIGGMRMASELVRPEVVSFLDRMLYDAHPDLRVDEIPVPDDSAAIGQTVGWLGVDELEGALLLAIRDRKTGDFVFKPSSKTQLEPGVTLIAMVNAEGRSRIERRLATGRRSTMLRPEA
jgi:voltage-gated potassium channel